MLFIVSVMIFMKLVFVMKFGISVWGTQQLTLHKQTLKHVRIFHLASVHWIKKHVPLNFFCLRNSHEQPCIAGRIVISEKYCLLIKRHTNLSLNSWWYNMTRFFLFHYSNCYNWVTIGSVFFDYTPVVDCQNHVATPYRSIYSAKLQKRSSIPFLFVGVYNTYFDLFLWKILWLKMSISVCIHTRQNNSRDEFVV